MFMADSPARPPSAIPFDPSNAAQPEYPTEGTLPISGSLDSFLRTSPVSATRSISSSPRDELDIKSHSPIIFFESEHTNGSRGNSRSNSRGNSVNNTPLLRGSPRETGSGSGSRATPVLEAQLYQGTPRSRPGIPLHFETPVQFQENSLDNYLLSPVVDSPFRAAKSDRAEDKAFDTWPSDMALT